MANLIRIYIFSIVLFILIQVILTELPSEPLSNASFSSVVSDQEKAVSSVERYRLDESRLGWSGYYPLLSQGKYGFGSSMIATFLCSLTLVPLFYAISSLFNTWPVYHAGHYYRRKRDMSNKMQIYRHLPLLNRDQTKRFLSLFEATLENRKIHNETCKKYYSCQVFRNALRSDSLLNLADLELALLNVFGIVAERYDHKLDLISAVKMYYEIAANAFKGLSCASLYPCSRQNTLPSKHQK